MPTFDGANLLITLDALPSPNDGSQSINVQDALYEQWKEWAQLPGNLGFPPAFRTIGGDPLTPGVEAGAYFFLRNDLGWRIISSAETQTINYSGNLVGEDSAIALIIPTPGETVLHLGLQPVTQRVDEILTEIQDSVYQGSIAIDVVDGVSGTAYPIGTRTNPVNNITDARTIADGLGIKSFVFRGNLTLNAAYDAWTFEGISAEKNDQLDLNGFSVDKSIFRSCGLSGSYTGTMEAIECDLDILTGVAGIFRRCGLSAAMTLASGATPIFADCYSEVPGTGSPSISCSGALGLNLRNYSGGITLTNIDSALFEASVDLDPGTLTLTSATNTTGTVLVRGTGTATIDRAVIGTTCVDRLLSADRQQEMHGQLQRSIYIDPAVSPNGTGYQQDPYNNITDAIDDAEANGITSLVLLGNVVLDRQLKNFTVTGVGQPDFTANNQILQGCEFHDLKLDGIIPAASHIRAVDCILKAGLTGVHGDFLNCGLDGPITLATGADVTMIDCYSDIAGLARPTLSVNGALDVSVRSYRGGLTVLDMPVQSPQASVTVSMAQGKLTLDGTCVGGVISVRGVAQFTDNSAGTFVDATGLLNTEELAVGIASLVGNATVSGDDLQVDILDNASPQNILRSLSVSADGRVRRII
jgi:hypothetical protein